MTQRSMLVDKNQTIIIKTGADVTVRGHEGDLVTAESKSRWGLSIERKSEAEFARARAAIGERVLFDLRFKKPKFSKGDEPGTPVDDEIIEVQMGGNGLVLVPYASNLKIYGGLNVDVKGVRGQVSAYSGLSLVINDVYALGNASAGRTMVIDCQTLPADIAEFNAGSDMRFHVAGLTSVKLRVKDLGGYWEAHIGGGEKSVYLKSGGDIIFVTDQKVDPLPPDFILGKIEKPAGS